MDKPFTGLTAEVKIGETLIGYMSGIDLTMDKSIIEILSFGSKWKEKVPAIKDWSATVDGTVAFSKDGSQMKLWDAYEKDTEIELGIYLDTTTYFKGKALVQSLNISGAPDDKMSISCELAGTGAMVLTVPLGV